MELLDRFNVDVIDIGRYFNTAEDYWHKLELITGCPGLYPKWFNPVKQPDGSWLAPGQSGEYIGKMPVGATFFDQLIFPYVNGYPDNFNNIGNDMSRVIWGGFGFPPYDRMNEKDFWKLLRETFNYIRFASQRGYLSHLQIIYVCNVKIRPSLCSYYHFRKLFSAGNKQYINQCIIFNF